ncbi:MAG: peptide-methionine (S)-S-oxide reductase [Nanohaloarchaea archaeon SW_7_46_7]|nr:MAG: peptide-methionine (S)-S-oxide reductase [Nanohaloarchaea archaeon SW_7_46_7]
MELDRSLLLILLVGVTAGFIAPEASEFINGGNNDSSQEWRSQVENKTPEKATFAGGCFWCIEEVYQGEKGIESAVSGFTDGKASTAEYRLVASGETEHREAVMVEYYPSLISYKELLDIYWRSIDPTDPGGQFADRGFQYTTAIYAHDERQYRLAKQSKKNLSNSGKFDEEIVTEVKNFTDFYRAKDYHQNYSVKNTYQYKAYKRGSGRTGYIERVWK